MWTIADLAEHTGAEVVGDGGLTITGAADLESAGPTDVAFLAPTQRGFASYEQTMRQSAAGVVFVSPEIDRDDGRNYLVVADPSGAFEKVVIEMMAASNNAPLTGFEGIHPSAAIHDDATIGDHVTIGPHATIDAGAAVGSNTFIGAGTTIGPQTTIGQDCTLHPNVVVREQCVIGDRVILQPGVVIGGCGFGYTSDNRGQRTKVQQLGNVVIGDDVEVGANTTIDRARFGSTRIGRGSKIDNLVMIAHGVEIGEDNVIVGQTGMAGSCKTGKRVILAGQVAVNGHIELCDDVVIAATSSVLRSVTEPGHYSGSPVQPITEFNRNIVSFLKLSTYIKQLKELRRKVAQLEKKVKG